jgi:hypothetical protein
MKIILRIIVREDPSKIEGKIEWKYKNCKHCGKKLNHACMEFKKCLHCNKKL